MRKLKLLMAACALLGSAATSWAQTDVTSTYLTNADFEGSFTSKNKIGNTTLSSRFIYIPNGWSDAESGTYNVNDASVLNSGHAIYSNIKGTTETSGLENRGNQTYGIRFHSSGSSAHYLTLSQSPTLPKGEYSFSGYFIANNLSNISTGVYLKRYTNDAYSLKTALATANAWTKVSIDFTVSTSASTVLGIFFQSPGGKEGIAGADNISLTYSNYKTELSTLIAQAEALSNDALSSAISSAQSVLDLANNSVEYQDIIDAAVTTLQAKIIDVYSADGASMTAAIINSGFEAGKTVYSKTKGGDVSHPTGWINSADYGVETYHYSIVETSEKSEGLNSFKTRFNWASASYDITQTLPSLPAGRYTITADVKVVKGSSSSISASIKGNTTESAKKTATTDSFETLTTTLDLREGGNLDIILSASNTNSNNNSENLCYWDNVTLTYNTPASIYSSVKTTAQDTYDNSDYESVTGSERTSLYNLLNSETSPSTAEEYYTAIDNINDAVTTFTAAKTEYDKFDVEKESAIAMGVSLGSIVRPTSADNLQTALNALYVLEDAAISTNYAVDATNIFGTWTPQNTGTASNEHWSGETKNYYNKYSDSGFTMSVANTVTLPAGNYILKAAARSNKVNNGNNFYLGVNIDGTWTKKTYTPDTGSTGLGIDLSGNANYTSSDETFANSNNGYGWEWRFVNFTLASETEVTMKISADIYAKGWISFSDITLLTTTDNIEICRQMYESSKTTAEAARDNDTYNNVHDGSEWTALNAAIDEAVPDPATVKWYQDQRDELDNATAAFTNATTLANYNRLAAAIAKADAISFSHSAYDITISTTGTTALSNANALYSSMLTTLQSDKAQGERVLGFETGEYAPYENVAVLTALSQAAAIGTVDDAETSALDAAITALNDASWSSANSAEVDAIYDGALANAEIQATSSNVVLPGWVTKSGNTRQTFKGTASKACLGEDEVGLFVHSGTYNYGETTGYTMPLKGGTTYVAQAKYCSWETNSNHGLTLTVKQDETTIANKTFSENNKVCTTSGAFETAKLYFTPESDGDYVLSIYANGNTFMTGFSILSYDVPAITIAETDTEVASASEYADVTLNRAFNKGWNAVCLPFATEAFDGAEIAEFTGEAPNGDNVTLNFTKVDAFEANKPYLVYFPEAVASGKVFSGVNYAPATVKTEGTAFDFMGTYTVTDIDAGNWVVSGGALKKASTTISLKPTRTYFAPKTANARIAGFFVDGEETTGIAVVESNGKMEIAGTAYNLNGQKMNGQLKKGIYVINGKKTIVK